MDRVRRRAPDLLAALFGTSGVVHLLRPQLLESLVPGWLPNARVVVYLSGVAELICAGGLFRRAPWAGRASAVLLVAVFPGNIQMALSSARADKGHLSAATLLVYARLPLQVPLIWAALQAGRSRKLTGQAGRTVGATDRDFEQAVSARSNGARRDP